MRLKRRINVASAKTNKSKKNSTPPKEPSLLSSPIFINGTVIAVLFVFTALFMYISSDAVLADAARSFLGGVVPAIFGGALIYLAYTKAVARMWAKTILSFAALTDMSAMIGLFAKYGVGSAYNICGAYVNGGGVAGVFIASELSVLIGKLASFIV